MAGAECLHLSSIRCVPQCNFKLHMPALKILWQIRIFDQTMTAHNLYALQPCEQQSKITDLSQVLLASFKVTVNRLKLGSLAASPPKPPLRRRRRTSPPDAAPASRATCRESDLTRMAEDTPVDSPKRKRGRPPKPEIFKVMAEDNPTDSPKRKRGRPPKPESEKAAAKRKAADSGDDSAPKRGRGRPKGSKNKSKKGSPAKGTGKRGRPPKNAPKESASEESAEDAE
ncbi:uncharacterized protein LOC134780915 [Penaeus indicus]